MKRGKSTAGKNGQGRGRQACSFWRRLLVMAYDAIAVIALLMAATALAMLAGFRELHLLRDPLYSLYLLTVWFAYVGWCWHNGGMTLGMRAWRVRIENDSGGQPDWGRCLLRFLASLLSALAAGTGFLWSLFDAEKRCWHDRLSGTVLSVVQGDSRATAFRRRFFA